jgi:hypothetical protein
MDAFEQLKRQLLSLISRSPNRFEIGDALVRSLSAEIDFLRERLSDPACSVTQRFQIIDLMNACKSRTSRLLEAMASCNHALARKQEATNHTKELIVRDRESKLAAGREWKRNQRAIAKATEEEQK